MYEAMLASRGAKDLEMDLELMGKEEDLSDNSPLFLSILRNVIDTMSISPELNGYFDGMDLSKDDLTFVVIMADYLRKLILEGIDGWKPRDFHSYQLLIEFDGLNVVQRVREDIEAFEEWDLDIFEDSIQVIKDLYLIRNMIELRLLYPDEELFVN